MNLVVFLSSSSSLARLLCPCGRPKKTLRAGSSVSMRTTWPTPRRMSCLLHCKTASLPYISYSSSLQRLLHCLSTHTDPSILLSIFFLNADKKVSSDLDGVHVSEACVSISTSVGRSGSNLVKKFRSLCRPFRSDPLYKIVPFLSFRSFRSFRSVPFIPFIPFRSVHFVLSVHSVHSAPFNSFFPFAPFRSGLCRFNIVSKVLSFVRSVL